MAFVATASAADLSVGDRAPSFEVQNHEGKSFRLEQQKGRWTVLYFYPKAETPGCTRQAATFRDQLKSIQGQGADVIGISQDSVSAQAAFHQHLNLNFPLLADEKGEVIALYGTKMPIVSLSKRWTFVIDPELKIRNIQKDVDPEKDGEKMAGLIRDLKIKSPHP